MELRDADVRELRFLVVNSAVSVEAGLQNDFRTVSDHKNPPSSVQELPEEKCVHQEGKYHKCASKE